MCKDCGCSIRGTEESNGMHSHDGGKTFHSHDDEHTHSHDEEHSHEHQKAHEHLHHNPQLNDTKTISVIQKILDKNDQEAEHNRSHFTEKGILGINLMSSPGAGKTTFLESLAEAGYTPEYLPQIQALSQEFTNEVNSLIAYIQDDHQAYIQEQSNDLINKIDLKV